MPFLTQSILLRTTLWKHFKLFTDMLLPPKYRNGSHKQMKKKRYKISIHWFSSRLMLFSRHLTPLGTRRYAVKASFFLLNLIWMIYPSCLCVIIIFTTTSSATWWTSGAGRRRRRRRRRRRSPWRRRLQVEQKRVFLILVFQMFCDTSFHICTYLQTDCAFRKNDQL